MKKSMIVKDIIRGNDPYSEVIVRGVNPVDDYDPHCEEYFHGKLRQIPEALQQCEVLQTAWSFTSQCHILHIAHTPIMEKFENNKVYPFQVFVKKLGAERITGRYVNLPATYGDMQKAFEHIGLDLTDDFGRFNEKWTIGAKIICYVPGLEDKISDMITSVHNLEELNYLAAMLKDMSPEEYNKFCAAIDLGNHTDSLQEIINVRLNLYWYYVNPDIKSYGDLGKQWIYDVPEHLKDYIDYEAYGRNYAKDHGGKVTKFGYVQDSNVRFTEINYGDPEDIPAEYRVTSKPQEKAVDNDTPTQPKRKDRDFER